jgi:hypothetical protein
MNHPRRKAFGAEPVAMREHHDVIDQSFDLKP